ncbi:MAG TPA: tetratricopeptide repeat protein [Kofleriaceae bacterium]|nr:tetratricopeptide repeat protein [Kofleriaceae bacterium]
MGELLTFTIGPRRGLRRGIRATDWYEQGCALEARAPEAAMEAYRRAIAGRPDLGDAHNNLGRLHHDRHELADAESCYRLAICVDAKVPLYWFNLGVALEDLGRHAEAIGAYERALELGPGSADAHFNLARLLELNGRQVGDEVLLRRAVRHLVRYRDLTRVSGTR